MARNICKRELKSEINIVPLLDILLVLLLIFMATSPIISQSVTVDLPDISNTLTGVSHDNPPIILEIAGVGQHNMLINNVRLNFLPEEQIIAEAKAQLKKNPKSIFLIGGAKEVPYNEVIKALNIFHQAGIKSVGLMTQPLLVDK